MSKPKEPETEQNVAYTEEPVKPTMDELMDKLTKAEKRAEELAAQLIMGKTASNAPVESAAEISARLDQQRFMVFLPSTGIKDEDTVPVIINGICTLIPKGKRVAVTRPVYEVLMRSEDAHMQTVRFDKEKENIDRTRERW